MYKRQPLNIDLYRDLSFARAFLEGRGGEDAFYEGERLWYCLLYTSDAADERSSVDLGGRRIIKKKNM